ncbi:glycine/betaine ABC transporter permease [Virgibacillus profundi]|uniref:Glycine/betaine ABC transporter permease n=1 Tax=Virgibacillus profundi TaxID=2024555 RepID=A0A2A2IGA7_9BACI|nr:BCCT family transporter [Virgibacillus profundi]PAV31031.1 glycine/betaine ABC transporter permease [Virgibacillus profundi]PXY55217.1 BCCT family transporter [Virgibacillus profundi]
MKKVSSVFYITIALVIIFVLVGALLPVKFEQVTTAINTFLSTTFGWYYMWLMSGLIILSIFIAVSPYGRIRLGKNNERPEFSTPTWIAMLFSAGLGIGLVFYGAAEPLSHSFSDAPFSVEGSGQALKEGLAVTFFHWGIHGWAMYGLVALALAYFQFRKGEPGLISSTLKPLFGDRMKGPIGKMIDVLATFATIFGVATSLGFGAMQISGGLSHLFGIEVNFTTQFIIITIITALFLMSAWSGLSKGIKYLSNANMVIAILLFLAVLIVGPTLLILNTFTETFGLYLQNIVGWSFRTASFEGDNRAWLDSWTIFYWAWWISWAPFVGMFIARVSRGRTIRQFMIGVMIVPTLIIAIWFSTFGTTATNVQKSGIDLTQYATELVLFNMFDQMSFSFILSLLAILLILTFFITSADSATFVLGMQSTNGSLTPPTTVKIILGLAQSSVALILLYVGGLTALQNTIIAAAFPFSFIMILMMISLVKALNQEVKAKR